MRKTSNEKILVVIFAQSMSSKKGPPEVLLFNLYCRIIVICRLVSMHSVLYFSYLSV